MDLLNLEDASSRAKAQPSGRHVQVDLCGIVIAARAVDDAAYLEEPLVRPASVEG